MHGIQRRAAGWLVLTVIVAESLAPFDFSLAGRAGRLGIGGPADGHSWLALLLHMVAFGVAGVLSAAGSAGSTSGTARHPARTFVFALGACLSLELLQSFVVSRHAELIDLLVNTTGLAVGIALWPRLRGLITAGRRHDAGAERSIRCFRGVSIWAAAWSILLLSGGQALELSQWDPSYALAASCRSVADHARPVRSYAALYDRALADRDVNLLLGTSPFTPSGLVARTSRRAASSLEPPQALSAGLRRAVDHTRVHGSFTFELACDRSDVDAAVTGAASFAQSEWRANVVLIAESTAVYAAVRNPAGGPNGGRLPVRVVHEVPVSGVHAIVTYARGLVTVARDGVAERAVVDLREPAVLLGFGHGPLGRAAAGLLAALSFLVAVGGRGCGRLRARGILTLTALAYVLLAPALVFAGGRQAPAVGLYLWLGPALVVTGAALHRGRRTNPQTTEADEMSHHACE